MVSTALSVPARIVRAITLTIKGILSFIWTFASLLLNPANMIMFALLCVGLYLYATDQLSL